ncbi:MAG: NDP-sugar synthase, partial [Betaproteobacteria bacterium]|nr:NDP-sugar synthase [Betaproteobacteria bacterium]
MHAVPALALVFEPEVPASLAPLLEQRPFGLLPLAGRPLLHHQLSALAAAGVREVQLYVSHLPHLTRDFVGTGARWGLRVRCHSVAAAGQFLERPLRALIDRRLGQGGIAMAMNCFVDAATLRAMMLECGAAPLRLQAGSGHALPCFAVPERARRMDAPSMARFHADDPILIDSPKALWQANVRLLEGMRSVAHRERRVADAVYLGNGCRLHESAQLAEPSLIGARSVLGRRTRVGAHSIIGQDVFLDESSEVHASIVFDGTYVGPHGFIEGKLVDGCRMVDVESGEAVYIDDPSLLGTSAQHRSAGDSLRACAEWMLAASMLALTALPVLGFALARALRGRRVLSREHRFIPTGRLLSGEVSSRKVALLTLEGVPHPAWRRVPWLLAVLKGELQLVGTTLPAEKPAFAYAALSQSYAMLARR